MGNMYYGSVSFLIGTGFAFIEFIKPKLIDHQTTPVIQL